MTMVREWEPWNGRAGRGQEPVAVVVHWTCDNAHPLQVIGSSDIDLATDEVHASASPWSQFVEYEGVGAYNLECDLCPRSAIISEGTARRFLEPLRRLFLEGRCDLVSQVNITAIGRARTDA